MASISRTVSGLILQTSFPDLTGYSGDTSFFTTPTDPSYIAFQYIPNFDFGPTEGGVDEHGTRQGNPFFENGVWYISYDGKNFPTTLGVVPDNSSPWTTNMAISYDRGLTWRKIYTWGPPNTTGDGTPLVHGWCMGAFDKFGSRYYIYRVLLDGTSGGAPYNGDVWSNTDLLGAAGTWQFEGNITRSGRTSADEIPGKVVKVGSTYYLFDQGQTVVPNNYTIGLRTALAPGGPWTIDNTVILSTSNLGQSGWPENPKPFYSSALSKYCFLTNSYIVSPYIRSDWNTIVMSSSISDWSTKKIRQIQHEGHPSDTGPTFGAIGVMTQVNGPDSDPVIGANGFIPAYYDGSGRQSNPPGAPVSYAWKRVIRGTLLEPSATALQYNGTGATLKNIFKAQANSDFVAEFTVEFLSTVAATFSGMYYRCDGTTNNAYRIELLNGSKLTLRKNVAGVQTTIATGSGSVINYLNMASRIRLEVSGASHKVYLDGELQIDVTDSAFSSGTNIGFWGFGNVTSQIRLFTMRTSPTVTVQGLQPGSNIILRADGKLPVAATATDSSGNASFTYTHYPLETFEVAGVDYTPSGGIWGGDTYSFSGFPVTQTPTPARALKKF